MITGTYDELKPLPDKYHCPEHDNPLTVAKHPELDTWVIRCGHGHYPEELITEPSRTQLFKRGELNKADPAFNLLPTKDLGSSQLLTPEQVQGLIIFANKYALDPYRGHVVLMYGQPYIGLDGYMFHANRSKVPFTLSSRPLTALERKDYQVEKGDHAWIASLDINQGEKLFTGLGVVTKQDLEEMSKKEPTHKRYPIVAAHPWQMCQKRAEWQVMRRGFPIGETEDKKEE